MAKPRAEWKTTRRAYGRIFRRGGQFWVRLRDGGKDRRIPAGPTHEHARLLLAELEAARLRGDPLAPKKPAPRATLADLRAIVGPVWEATLAPEWSKAALRKLDAAAKFFGQQPLAGIQTAAIRDYLAHLTATKSLKPVALNHHRGVLRRAFAAAVERGLADGNPVAAVKALRVPEHPVPYLAPEQVDAILAAAPRPLRDALRLAVDTGLRFGELRRLEWRDAATDRVTVRRGKGGRVRVVPLTRAAAEALRRLRARRPRGAARVLACIPNAEALRRGVPGWAKKARVEGRLTFHGLRHAFCSALAREGIPLPDIQRLAGHARLETTLRYARHAPHDAGERAIREWDRARLRARVRAQSGSRRGRKGASRGRVS